jgi:hypothetical protein
MSPVLGENTTNTHNEVFALRKYVNGRETSLTVFDSSRKLAKEIISQLDNATYEDNETFKIEIVIKI